jgi:hypothetical protein
LPQVFQGEGVAYTRDGSSLLLTSEGEDAPVHRVPAADLGAPDQDAGAPSSGSPVLGRAPWAAGAALVVLGFLVASRRRRHR